MLQLIAQGLSNQAIADRLFLALSTVKGYARTIFDKLQVERRTEAAARALPSAGSSPPRSYSCSNTFVATPPYPFSGTLPVH